MSAFPLQDKSDKAKRALAIPAAVNECSQIVEDQAIPRLEELLLSKQNWLSYIYEDAQSVGGINTPLPERRIPRITGIKS